MSAADRTEKVLREIHILFSKAEVYPARKTDVIVDKRRMMELLKELNACIYDIMEEHEMTVQSREAAIRQVKRQNDEQIAEAQKNAEDIYAASIMYSDRALVEIREIVRSSIDDLDALHEDMRKKLRDELRTMKTNQYELKSQLQDLIDTDKYLKLIDDENKRILEEKKKQEELEKEYGSQPDVNPYASIKPEIRVNPAYIPDTEKPLTPEEMAMADEEAKREKEEKAKKEKEEKEKAVSGIETAGGNTSDGNEKKNIAAGDETGSFPDLSEALTEAAKESILQDEAMKGDASGNDEIARTIRAAAGDSADIRADQAVAALAADLDAEYFDWKDDKEETPPEEEPPKKKGFSLFRRKDK